MLDPRLSRLAVTGVILLILFLSYASQLFLLHPYLSLRQSVFFNTLIVCIWITYARSILTHPGSPPAGWAPADAAVDGEDAEEGRGRAEERRVVARGGKWCRRCKAWKPPRCHHCKTCKTCVLRMDHHCPWTANCVGYRNLPHFLRFLFFSSITTLYLLTHLLQRGWALWETRHSPSHHSPHTLPQLLLLFLLLPTCAFIAFALSILYLRTLWSAADGYTTIETWEQDRHNALVRRKRVARQQFPYDIGFWDNLCAAHGATGNVLAWYWPLAATREVGEVVCGSKGLRLAGGVEWEVNGFERLDLSWPPVDPDKVALAEVRRNPLPADRGLMVGEAEGDWAEGVRRRQREDLRRRGREAGWEKTWREEEEMWTNTDGETLADYGVDLDAEDGDEDIPLAELLRRRAMR